MSIHKQPQSTVKAWQHAIDHDRVLIAWPDGTTTVVVKGDYIDVDTKAEAPDAWIPIGKPQFANGGVVRGGWTAHPGSVSSPCVASYDPAVDGPLVTAEDLHKNAKFMAAVDGIKSRGHL